MRVTMRPRIAAKKTTNAAKRPPPTTMIGIALLWISAIFTIYTGWDYFRAGIHHLIEEDEA